MSDDKVGSSHVAFESVAQPVDTLIVNYNIGVALMGFTTTGLFAILRISREQDGKRIVENFVLPTDLRHHLMQQLVEVDAQLKLHEAANENKERPN